MQDDKSKRPIYGFFSKLFIIIFIALAIYFLYIHRIHLAAYSGSLVFLIFLACPLMHLFMHGGHGHGGHHHDKHESKHQHDDEDSDKEE